MPEVVIEKLVHGGQGLGSLPDGRRVFVWGVLPGERVAVRITKDKHSYAEGNVEAVVDASPARIEPKESNYLATSPWQIIDFAAENAYKQSIVEELFQQAKVPIPQFTLIAVGGEWRYRNKMEYSFWGDEHGLSLALHGRGSHQKVRVEGSELALQAIDEAASSLCEQLQRHNVRAGELKTVIVRCSQTNEIAVSLFVKTRSFLALELPNNVQGLRVYYSNPKSPASVPTMLLQETGDVVLHDILLGRSLAYDVDSFFQVNIPVFEAALKRIKTYCRQADHVVDMYAGVGSIGLSVASKSVQLIESDPATAAMARLNAATSNEPVAEVIEAPSEKSLEFISVDATVIVDPPRAGLHERVTQRILETLPREILYLSCNPATQARDLANLQTAYDITNFEAFNFFPHTPHIETLAVLSRRDK